MLRTILKAAPRLQDGDYSQGLRDFVAYCLEERPQDRPTAEQILQHPYIANTLEDYPTATLRELIDRYVQWEGKGGQRASLFNPYGAAAPQAPEQQEDSDDWNFSTTDNFDQDFAKRYSQMGISATDFALQDGNFIGRDMPVSHFEEVQEEIKAKRGEKSMERLFDPHAAPYDYNTPVEDDQPMSDLPLRNMSSDRAANRETLIDLDMGESGLDSQPTFNFDFGDVPTLKAARPSRASVVTMQDDDDNEDGYDDIDEQATKRATKDWKMPWDTTADVPNNRVTRDWKMPWGETSLTESANANANRKTQDWTFPLSAIATENSSRRTQDWTFATAEVSEGSTDTGSEFTFPPAQSQEDIIPGFRPTLTRTATEPIGQYDDYLHPPTHNSTSKIRSASVRESRPVIDLDMAVGPDFGPDFDFDNTVAVRTREREVSPAVSAADSTETRRNPFFLDEVDRHDEDSKRSSHRQSRSEPHLLAPMSQGSRLLHLRGPSTESLVRHNRDRGYSLSSTASSDMLGSTWGKEYNRRMGEHTRDQLMNDLHTAAMAPRGLGVHSRINSFDTDMDSAGATGIMIPDMDDDGFPLAGMKPLRSIATLNEGVDENGYVGLRVDRSRPRADTGGTTTTNATSNGYDSSREDRNYMPKRSTRTYLFPRVLAPDPEALGEMADQDVVDQELDRLLDDLQNGLGAAADILNRRDRELSGAVDEGEDIPHHFQGFGSEGDGEGVYY